MVTLIFKIYGMNMNTQCNKCVFKRCVSVSLLLISPKHLLLFLRATETKCFIVKGAEISTAL